MSDNEANTSQKRVTGKVYSSPEAALDGMTAGASILIAGFAGCGWPEALLRAIRDKGIGGLTCICQGAWPHQPEMADVAELVATGQVKKLIAPLGFVPGFGGPVEERWNSGDLEIENVPQGVLAERLRAGGAGLGGVFLPTGVGTRFARGKEVRTFEGRDHVLESPLRADFALLRAFAADTVGNLVYRGSQRNWNPVMAMAGAICIAEVDQIHEPGGIDPETVITPGIFIDRVVRTV